MIELFMAGAMAATFMIHDTEIAVPTNIEDLETAQFRKPIYYAQRHGMAAERLAKKANCKMPSAEQWVHARIEAAILVSPRGRLLKVVPVESGCRPLEDYTVKHLSKYASKIAPIPPGGKSKWYRTAMYFRWPE
ncbi:hypothetical protein MNBD_ALPHA04-664 [hydrothermal vent metagenome]|uniref:TonB C-terminal domain-containing protein n=1 Tax=hydrothermal vent metagenome TaxID=652676 RepID=A0A3B0RVA6_9ZZZZ